MKDNDFISQMLLETLNEDSSSRNDFMFVDGPSDAMQVEAFFDSVRSCYCLNFAGQAIEIPSNWGPFKNRVAKEFSLVKSEDSDYFLDIISEVYGQDIKSIKVFIHSVENDSHSNYSQAA